MGGVKKPRHQTLAVGFFWSLLGLIALGTLLDSISNALSLVTPVATLVGTGLLLVVWAGLEAWLRAHPVRWVVSSGVETSLTRLGTRPRWGLAGAVALLWLPRLIGAPEPLPVPPASQAPRPSLPAAAPALEASRLPSPPPSPTPVPQTEAPTAGYQPPSSEVLRLSRVSLERWRAQHPDLSIEIRVFNNDSRPVQKVVMTVEDLLAAAGIKVMPGWRVGKSGGVPIGFMVVAGLPAKAAAAEFRDALGHLCTGAVLDIAEMPSDRVILHFNATPLFTRDGRVVFE